MKNRDKGFTLVEILVTIIILGLLVTIVYTSARTILDKGNNNYYKSQENMFLLAGKEYFTDYREKLPKEIGNTNYVTLKTLIEEKYIDKIKDKNDEDCDVDESVVTAQKVSEKEYQYYAKLVCSSYSTDMDKIKPVIVFSPESKSNTESIEVTMKVTDNKEVNKYRYVIEKDGSTYYDSNYQDYSGPVTISLTELGIYKITGYAIDLSGNSSKKESGKYSVYDKIDCSGVNFESENGNITNEDLKIKISVPSETHKWELRKQFNDGNYETVNTYIGNSSQNVTFEEEGKYRFAVILYDEDGNSCITNSSEYEVDKTPPACPSFNSSVAEKKWLAVENVSFTFGFSDDTVKWKWYTGTVGSDWIDWGDKSIDNNTVSISGQGKRTIKTVVYDLAGNYNECFADKEFYIDRSKPTLSVILKKKTSSATITSSDDISKLSNYTAGSSYNGYVVLRGSCSDSYSSCTVSYKVTGASTNTDGYFTGTTRNINANGTSTVTYKATDSAGNITTASYKVVLNREKTMYFCRDGYTNIHLYKSVSCANTSTGGPNCGYQVYSELDNPKSVTVKATKDGEFYVLVTPYEKEFWNITYSFKYIHEGCLSTSSKPSDCKSKCPG